MPSPHAPNPAEAQRPCRHPARAAPQRGSGVGRVSVEGGLRPAIRIEADLARLASYRLSLEDLRLAIAAANVAGPKGSLDGAHQSYTIAANDQIDAADVYRTIVVAYRDGRPVLLRDVAEVQEGLENKRVGGWFQGEPAVILDIQRQPGANIIQTVDRILAELPRLRRAMPSGVDLKVVHDRTETIRASIADVQFTLILSADSWCLSCCCSCAPSGPPSSPAWPCRLSIVAHLRGDVAVRLQPRQPFA